MSEVDAGALVLRGVESLEGMRSEIAQTRQELSLLRQELTQVRQDGQARGTAQALSEAQHGHALEDLREEVQAVRKELQRREDREDASLARVTEARKTLWTSASSVASTVWNDPTFRALLAAAVIGWLGLRADVIKLVPGISQ